MNAPSPGPRNSHDADQRLADALREQDATPAEIADWTPVIRRFARWPERTITPADTNRLLAALAPLTPTSAPSLVRQAVRERFARRHGSLLWLLDTARIQVSVLRPSFWLLSAAVMALGVYAEFVVGDTGSVFLLRALSPLLAYLGITAMFRGVRLRMIECELGCPPSALQLTIARLVVVLGYDVGLGLCLGLALWLRGGHGVPGEVSFLALTLHWLTPLLLVAGVALALSLRLPVAVAAALAYLGWLAGLVLYYTLATYSPAIGARQTPAIPMSIEIALGVAGLTLLTLSVWRLPAHFTHLLPTG